MVAACDAVAALVAASDAEPAALVAELDAWLALVLASPALVLAVLAEVAAAEALACAASRADWATTLALVDALDAVSALVA